MRQRLTAAVVAAHPLAAQTGAAILRRGGSAVDAAIATAVALAVVDPQNCGIGGHGGAMLVQQAARTPATLVDFNTAVPADFAGQCLVGLTRDGAEWFAARCNQLRYKEADVFAYSWNPQGKRSA